MAIFYKEVVDAIARTAPPDSDLLVLRDLCAAVDASDKRTASPLAKSLVTLSGTETRLHDISYELYYALMARMLVERWFDEFDLVLDWDQTIFSNKNSRTADKWEGIIGILTKDPKSLGLAGQVDHEKEFQRALNGFEGVIRHFAKVKFPTPSSIGAPPEPPPLHETVLPRILHEAVEEFFRVLQTIFQRILELALARLERDNNDVHGLRTLQKLRLALGVLLDPDDDNKSAQLKERLQIVLDKRIRVVEFRYGRDRAKQHRFLDAFPPFDSRSVIFNSLDREDKDEPFVRGEKIGTIQATRTRQLPYLATMYGHPADASKSPDASHLQRRAFIKNKQGGQLKFIDNDDLILFLGNFFDDKLAELLQQAGASPDRAATAEKAWRETIEEQASSVFKQLTTHSRLNLTEGPPNYLTHTFPRNLAGRMLHDCGVFAVRWAYVLLSVLERINRSHDNIAGTVRARWVRLPLHVGLMIESDFGLLVQHNENASVWNVNDLRADQQNWDAGRPTNETDPTDPAALMLKFHEDLAANGFSADLDMPIRSIPVLADREAVTKQTIWNSYQKKVVPSQLFTSLVGASNTPQYQFDVRYLRLSEEEREWFNVVVLRFWNVDCNKLIWDKKWKAVLTDQAINNNPAELKKKKEAYADELTAAMNSVDVSYIDHILPKKQELSKALRDDQKQLLLPDIRIVTSERLTTVLPEVERVQKHLQEIEPATFKFTSSVPPFVPPFARPEELLLERP